VSVVVQSKTTVKSAPLERMIARLSPPSIEAVIAHFAQLIYDTAYPDVPEESGRDKASLRVILEGMAARISLGEGVDPPYPVYQELGFHHAGTGTFIQNAALLPAFERHRAAFVAAIVALVRG
jgi:hypothetical protein